MAAMECFLDAITFLRYVSASSQIEETSKALEGTSEKVSPLFSKAWHCMTLTHCAMNRHITTAAEQEKANHCPKTCQIAVLSLSKKEHI